MLCPLGGVIQMDAGTEQPVVEGAACFQVGGGERDMINPKQVRHEGSPVMIRQHRPDIDAAPDAASSLRLIGEASRVLGEPGKTGYPG
jgi:hypothetical protein